MPDRFVPSITTGRSTRIDADATHCEPCLTEGLGHVKVAAIIDGTPMCHECACEELNI